MCDPPHPRLPSSQPIRIPFPPSASPHTRHPEATTYREGPTSSGESPRSGSSRGSSDLIFPMDPPSPPDRRVRLQSNAAPTAVLPPSLPPSLSVRCSVCAGHFTPRSDYAARRRMCDECRVPTRRPVQDAAVADTRRVPIQRLRRNDPAPPYRFFSQGTLAPPVVTRAGRHEEQYTAATPPPPPLGRHALAIQLSRNGPPLCSSSLSSAEQQFRSPCHWSRVPRRSSWAF